MPIRRCSDLPIFFSLIGLERCVDAKLSADGKGSRQRNGQFVTSQRFCSVYLFAAFDKVRASDSSLVRYEGEGGMSDA